MSFIKSVTFNKDIIANQKCEASADKKEISCTLPGKGYDGTIYTLKIKVEVVQYENFESVWGIPKSSVIITKLIA